MWFVLVGVALLALKLIGVMPVAVWSWWIVLAPFGLAAAWWAYADATGRTQRIAMKQMDEKKAARRDKQMEALGQGDPTKRRRR
jgi:small Trp-rich protein